MVEEADVPRSTQQRNLFRLKLSVQQSIVKAVQDSRFIQHHAGLNAADRKFRRENVLYRQSKSGRTQARNRKEAPRRRMLYARE